MTITARSAIFSKSSFTVDQRRVGAAADTAHAPTDVLVLALIIQRPVDLKTTSP